MNRYPQLNGVLTSSNLTDKILVFGQLTTFNKNKGATGNPEAPLLANIKLVAVEGVEPPTLRI